jgi:phosphoserine phosphatase
MRPSTWLLGPGGERPVKTSFADRAFSNFDLVCLDDRFDVVGAAVHTGDAEYARDLRAAYGTRTGREISPERWLLYELVHLWDTERLGGVDAATVGHRKSQAMRRYLAEVLLGDVADPGEGPVVALDVDGVLETDLLGFKAPTPASVTCLRALSAHGFRTVLVTGRPLDDVVELSDLFRLAGGAAEYGSVVYDRRAAATAPLVADDELAALTRLRDRLEPEPAVRVDPRHRFSVRASTVDGRQRLRTFVPAPTLVPDELRSIVGEAQTDFVSARIDKVDGARALLRGLGQDRPVLAVGDTAADVGLLGWAPLSVVPRHADAPARAAATRVARLPYQAGLAHAVGSLIGHHPGGCDRCAAPEMTDDTRAMLRLLRVSEGSRRQVLLRSVSLAWAERPGRR